MVLTTMVMLMLVLGAVGVMAFVMMVMTMLRMAVVAGYDASGNHDLALWHCSSISGCV